LPLAWMRQTGSPGHVGVQAALVQVTARIAE